MKKTFLIPLLLLITLLAAIVWQIYCGLQPVEKSARNKADNDRPVPVEVSPITTGPIALIRHFNGTLEAHAEFFASPKVGGVVESVSINLRPILMTTLTTILALLPLALGIGAGAADARGNRRTDHLHPDHAALGAGYL